MGKHTLLLATTKVAKGQGGCQEQSDTLPSGKKACIWFCYRYQVATTPKSVILTSLLISVIQLVLIHLQTFPAVALVGWYGFKPIDKAVMFLVLLTDRLRANAWTYLLCISTET